VVLRETARNGV